MNLTTIGFDYGAVRVRVVMVGGEPSFVAKDLCDVLGLGDVSKAVSRLDEDEKGTNLIPTPGGVQQLLTVTEAGMFSLILSSRKQEAKAFKRWITHDVLPSIRKTGSYEAPHKRTDEVRWNEAEAKVRNSRARQAKVISDLLSKFGDRLSDNSVPLLVGEVAAIAAGHPVLPKPKIKELYKASEIGKELGVSANKIGRVANGTWDQDRGVRRIRVR